MASSSKPNDLHIANDLRLADEDLKAAESLFDIQNRYAPYHLQQCAEKVLLALLIAEDTQIERRDSHRLDVLRDKLPDDNPFKERLRSLVLLTQFATTFRYPKDGGRMPKMPERDAVKGWAVQLRSIVDDAADHFGVDLDGSDQDPASNVTPPSLGRPAP